MSIIDKKYNVLIFPGGTEIGLEIFKSLYYCKNIELYSVGQNISNHAPYVFSKHFIIPSVHDLHWITSLNKIITDYGIHYIFPAHDDVIVALAKNQHQIKAKIVSSPLRTCLITRSKSETYQFFKNIIPVPELYDDPNSIDRYPVFLKPDKGQGSQHTYKVHNKEYLLELLKEDRNYIITEYLPGEEYTVDCFSDREKGILFCSGRQRIRTRNGISMNSRLLDNKSNHLFFEYATIIAKNLDLHGAWFFQLKKDCNGVYKLLEVAPRIPGTMALQRVRGINLPLLSLYEQERILIEVLVNNQVEVEIDRALVNRYKHEINYDTVYVDLDDTLIVNNKINTNLIKFLYQCINRKKHIVLITKHIYDVEDTLKKYRIDGVFDEVIHLNALDNKANFIIDKNSIFIDDSFSERQSVSQQKGILTFDCSMLELLLEEFD